MNGRIIFNVNFTVSDGYTNINPGKRLIDCNETE